MGPCPSRGEKVGEGPDHLAVGAWSCDVARDAALNMYVFIVAKIVFSQYSTNIFLMSVS